MRTWTIFVFLLTLVLPVSATAQISQNAPTLDEFVLALKKRDTLGVNLRLALAAAGDAFGWANAVLESRGSQPLYCQPATLTLNQENLVKIALDEYARRKSQYDQVGQGKPAGSMTSHVLLFGLIETFPCK